jgi:hypothetical protein
VRLCLDEDYSDEIAVQLRAAGHDVDRVKERPELISLSDAELLATMTVERRALLTENVGDFAPPLRALTAGEGSHYGVIFSSSRSMPRSRATIGNFVRALSALLQRFPGEDDFRDRIEWLSPLKSK